MKIEIIKGNSTTCQEKVNEFLSKLQKENIHQINYLNYPGTANSTNIVCVITYFA